MSGSNTAKNGYNIEKVLLEKIQNYKNEKAIFGIDTKIITNVNCEIVSKHKWDIVLNFDHLGRMECYRIQVKSFVGNGVNNQIEKRWIVKPNSSRETTVDYKTIFKLPDDITNMLEAYTGVHRNRMKITEFSEADRLKLLQYLELHKDLLLRTVITGLEDDKVTHYVIVNTVNGKNIFYDFTVQDIINKLSGDVVITKRGNIMLGNVIMKRYGGEKSNGAAAAMLQFQFNPKILI